MLHLKVIDAHTHLPIGKGGLKRLIKACEEANIVKCFLCGLPEGKFGAGNEAVEKAMKEYPDLIMGFAYIDLGRDNPHIIDEYYSRGFFGFKFIEPPKPYDSDEYFPYYERMEACSMPALFHTGIVARGVKTDERGITSKNMRPICLERIARTFRNLILIGAHLGHPWCHEAAVTMLHNPNIYFDISGGHTFQIALTIHSRLHYDVDAGRLLFGSDSTPENIIKYLHYWQIILPQLGLTRNEVESILYRNALNLINKARK